MTLEEYLRYEMSEGKIDFWFRASGPYKDTNTDAPVEIYIHPHGREGRTTRTLVVEGNTVREKY